MDELYSKISDLEDELEEQDARIKELEAENINLRGMVCYYQNQDPIKGKFRLPDGELINPNDVKEAYSISLTPPKENQ